MQTVIDSLDRVLEKIHEMNCNRYKQIVLSMTDEQLGYEWCDRGEFEWEFHEFMQKKGRDFIEWRLIDSYEVSSFNKLLS